MRAADTRQDAPLVSVRPRPRPVIDPAAAAAAAEAVAKTAAAATVRIDELQVVVSSVEGAIALLAGGGDFFVEIDLGFPKVSLSLEPICPSLEPISLPCNFSPSFSGLISDICSVYSPPMPVYACAIV